MTQARNQDRLEGYRFLNEMIGAHHGQTDHHAYAIGPEGDHAGSLSYSIFEGKAHVNIVLVEEGHTRKGIASRLLDMAADEAPRGISFGMTTPAGTALRNAWFARRRNRAKAAA